MRTPTEYLPSSTTAAAAAPTATGRVVVAVERGTLAGRRARIDVYRDGALIESVDRAASIDVTEHESMTLVPAGAPIPDEGLALVAVGTLHYFDEWAVGIQRSDGPTDWHAAAANSQSRPVVTGSSYVARFF